MNVDEKNCPYCAEVIKTEAVFCRFCKTSLVAQPQPVVVRPSGGGAVKWIVIGVVGFFFLVIAGAIVLPAIMYTQRKKRLFQDDKFHRPPVERRVTCESRARTWRPGCSPFDIRDEVAKRLRDSGVEIATSGPDGQIEIDFEETEGQKYIGTASGTSSNFHLELVVRSPDGAQLARIKYSTSTSYTIHDHPSSASISAFRESPITQALGNFVGTALGVRACFPRLMPLDYPSEVEAEALRILNAQKYEPADAKDRARLAAARDDFDACVKIGKEAVGLLLPALESAKSNRAARIARALGEIGDPRAIEPLRSRLGATWIAASQAELLVALLEALGKLKDRGMLVRIRELETCTIEEVARAATKARELIEK